MKAQNYTVSRNGYNVSCKLYCEDRKAIRGVVLFGHGFGGHKDNRAAERFAQRALDKLHLATVTFNWPCHGDDVRKKLRLGDCDGYLSVVIEDIRERFNQPRLYAYATSFGGFLFLKYIMEHGSPFRRIALRCPAVDMYNVLTHAFEVEGGQYDIRIGASSADMPTQIASAGAPQVWHSSAHISSMCACAFSTPMLWKFSPPP